MRTEVTDNSLTRLVNGSVILAGDLKIGDEILVERAINKVIRYCRVARIEKRITTIVLYLDLKERVTV